MRLRIATFNLESLDDAPGLDPPLPRRLAVLRPILDRLDADLLCLQEVNGQLPGGRQPRQLLALDALLAGTPLGDFHRAATPGPHGAPADRHNLVVLSRWPILESRSLRHDLVPPPLYRPVTALPPSAAAAPVEWDRPILHAAIALPGGRRLDLLNLHLRAPLAAPVAGQKQSSFVWRSAAGWAEGFYIAAMKRTGQALEARLLVDRLFDADPDGLIAVAGDLNAEALETPVRAIQADAEDTGNPALAGRSLSAVETGVPEAGRFSVLHHGRRLMLDHLLASPALARCCRRTDILNEGLLDEYFAYLAGLHPAASFHAPVVAEFVLPD
ncbi:MAG: endonuclease/exonuclease/phosphatase family protein [Alphaproteobacteria bacterium]